ncbi:hypothetical protein FRX31_026672 [Thalictrum thalictroides]|uniref:Uncharacterized protein n=1 Tax=Thalictrum thalictroides TaxID=46969 RepID=A0A7J6VGB5_THATH|nr:hypothetical protein FRX31_026672 [Thalictrum thalictroides]
MPEEEEESCCLKSNKEDDDDNDNNKDEPWLQLGLGGDSLLSSGHQQSSSFNNPVNLMQTQGGRCNELVELDLLPSSSSSLQPISSLAFNPTNNNTSSSSTNTMMMMNFHQPLLLQHHHQQQQFSLEHRPPYLWHHPFNSLPSSSSLPVQQPHPSIGMGMGMYYSSSSSLYNTISPSSSSSSGIRVIDAPRKLRSGVWFMIQASQNQ